jgi:histidine ammonia-lyase
MLLRANALLKGHSGIRPETLSLLVDMLNAQVHPVIPEKGSLGASGDLAPLAHMALVLIGEGEALYQGEILPGGEAMKRAGLTPAVLSSKEGLALINGTQVMTGIGVLAYWDAENLVKQADVVASMTLEALEGIIDPFDERIHNLRPHPGQRITARNVGRVLAGSGHVTRQGEKRVQDAYALRCIPQIHGATRDALSYVKDKLEIEINAATDNPLIFPETGDVISQGNFHGQPMALAFDFLGIAVSEIANVSERRLERLVNPNLSGLPGFLAKEGGLNSGFMIVQYSAASLVSENKILAHPASVDSIPSSANQEDHVSMGTIGARKAAEIIDNVRNVLAMEWMAAGQAYDLKGMMACSPATQAGRELLRTAVPFLEKDQVMYPLIQGASQLLAHVELLRQVEALIGPLD